jgi:membrane protease YdiL (CAAX protease family)
MTSPSVSQGPFWKKFTPLFAAGAVGLIAIVPSVVALISRQLEQMSNPPSLSLPALTALSMIQPTVLLAGAVAAGAALAPRLGLRSHLVAKVVADKPLFLALRSDLPLAAAAGALSYVAIAAGDLAFRPFVGESLQAAARSLSGLTVWSVLGAVLYGGITEELLLRWGLMTLVAWIGWRVVQRGHALPRPAIMWTAILLSAIIFGLGHLPATAALVPLTPTVIARAVVLNGIGGVIFGWLYWRRSLEAGMIAHASFHVCSTLVALIQLLG